MYTVNPGRSRAPASTSLPSSDTGDGDQGEALLLHHGHSRDSELVFYYLATQRDDIYLYDSGENTNTVSVAMVHGRWFLRATAAKAEDGGGRGFTKSFLRFSATNRCLFLPPRTTYTIDEVSKQT